MKFSRVLGAQLRMTQNVNQAKSENFRQSLRNIGDVQYTAQIEVGGQKLQGILDTGSFELLVLSKECKVCGDAGDLYDSAASFHFQKGKSVAQHNFGSGTTFSKEGFDTVSVGPLRSTQQRFWKVFDAMMPILEDSAFAAIVGVGPPDSAEKLAEDDNGDLMAIESEFKQNVLVDAVPPSLCTKFGVHTFSVCIGQDDGSHGFFIWNDLALHTQGVAFTHVPVAGSIHWAVQMTDVRIGHGQSSNDHVVNLGCKHGCAAVVDSGTSLIAAPEEVIAQVDEALLKLNQDCSNLGEMPDLVFNLGGHQFSLPPDAYIGQVVHHGKPGIEDLLHFHFRSHNYSCTPLLMSIDVDSQIGPMWILGLPFFRKYYTTFSYDMTKTNKAVQKQLSMALANDECSPTEGNALLGRSRAQMRPKRVELSQLRLPLWAEEAIKTKKVVI